MPLREPLPDPASPPSPLDDATVVCLGTIEWLVTHSVAEYTMLDIARTHRVLFVEPFSSLVTSIRVARSQRRTYRRRSGLRRAGENLYIYAPPPIGLPGMTRFRWVARVNGVLLAWLLRRVFRKLRIDQPVMYSYLHDSADALRRVPARLRVYECLDHEETLAKNERHRELIRRHEAEICRAADIVFAVTEELAASRRQYNPRTFVVNTAANLEFFQQAALETTPVPEDIAQLPKPVLGYLGGVDPWKIDVELLSFLARSHPEWSIALVGYVWYGFDPACFASCANIHVLGARPYEHFPGYLKGMDVCLMPFPLNGITRHGDALKLYEYLAGGKPVVSARVPAAVRLREVVRIADTPEQFVTAITESLAEGPEAAARRLAAVRPHCWENRVRQKMEHMRACLAGNARCGGLT